MTDRLVVAVDIGASKTLLTIRSVRELSGGWRPDGPVVRTDSHSDPGALVDWVETEVGRFKDRSGGRVAAIGVAAPGPLDATGVVLRSSNLGWRDVPLSGMLGERLGAPVALEDDANTAALGEWQFGAGVGTDPFAYLTVSSGIGGGIVAAGQIVRGARGNAGEVGHLVIDPAGPRCACGRRGDVESYAGGAALSRQARRIWPRATTLMAGPRRGRRRTSSVSLVAVTPRPFVLSLTRPMHWPPRWRRWPPSSSPRSSWLGDRSASVNPG